MMRQAVETYIKELEDSLFAARQAALSEGILVGDLNGECIVLHKAIAIKSEEVAGLKMAFAQAETIIESRKYDIDCRICQHYCETNGCEMDDCNKGADFKKSGTLRLWDIK